jgi:hypothetical protein
VSELESGFKHFWLDPTGLKESLYLFFAKAYGTSTFAYAVASNASLLHEIVNRGGGDP